ncbi:MAG TPA: PaaI family thioesterase [Allosphingosinicella sp.]
MATISYGVCGPEDIAGMTGREMLEAMVAGRLPAPPIGRTLGFRLVEVGDGLAVFEGDPGPHLLNPLGSVHGGWAMTLVDSATGCALHTLLPAGVGYTTVETKVNMTRPIGAGDGTVRCEGRVVSQGRQIATAEARLTSAEGKLLAHGTSTLMILRPR